MSDVVDRTKLHEIKIRLPDELHDRLRKISKKQHGTMTAQVTDYILRGLREDEMNDTAKEDQKGEEVG